MLKRVPRQEAEVYHLPGRDFLLCIGPKNIDAKNLALGLAVFPGRLGTRRACAPG